MGAAPKFEDQKDEGRRLTLGASQRAPVFESIDPGHAEGLYEVAISVVSRAEALLDFVDSRRDQARRAGIESIAIELSSVLEGGRLVRVIDALERSAVKEIPAQVSLDGLRVVRRAERLVAEASRSIRIHMGPVAEERMGETPEPPSSLPAPQDDGVSWPLVILGALGLGAALVTALVLASTPQPPPPKVRAGRR